MEYKKILTVQDISCVGQCSLTVALPILSACGLETCVIPSAVLSTHTGGFTGYTFLDLTDEIPAIQKHWEKERISFDAIYTGYLGSTRQIDYVKDLMNKLCKSGGIKIVDPAMADDGKLYTGFDEQYTAAMARLCREADIILPNTTEACLLTGTPWQQQYDEAWINSLLDKLFQNGAKTVILTGVGYSLNKTGVIVADGSGRKHYEHKLISKGCHGTGDVYASAFTGAFLRGYSAYDAARIGADYTVRCIESTIDDPDHWYGVKFEKVIPELLEAINAGQA